MAQKVLVVALLFILVPFPWGNRSFAASSASPESAGHLSTQRMKKAVILFSYQKDWWGVRDENQGILAGLDLAGYKEGSDIEITRLYMNTKTVNKTAERMESAAVEMLDRIRQAQPDVLFIMDDDALQHVGAKLLDSDLPIVFAGINFFVTDPDYGWLSQTKRGPLADSLDRPGHNITGVLERVSLSAGFNLLHQILPEAKTVLILSDNSLVGTLFLRASGGDAAMLQAPLRVVDKIYTDSFAKLKSIVLDYQDKVDSIVLFLPWTLEDEEGKHVPQEQVVRWMLKNNKRPGIAYLDILAEEGYLCGVVVDMVKQGYHAGVIGGRILNGEKAGEIPIVNPIASRIVINLARAKHLGIEIPFEVLRSADVVFKTMSAYPEFKMDD
jgi:putative ABC transport system substrate-binding protein